MLTPKQRQKRLMQSLDIAGDIPSIFDDSTLVNPKIGQFVDFFDEDQKQFSGKIVRISKDQWRNIIIDYGVPGRTNIILPSRLTKLINLGKAQIREPKIRIGCQECINNNCNQVKSVADISELYDCKPDITEDNQVKCCFFCSKRKNCDNPCEYSVDWKEE